MVIIRHFFNKCASSDSSIPDFDGPYLPSSSSSAVMFFAHGMDVLVSRQCCLTKVTNRWPTSLMSSSAHAAASGSTTF
ncbi:hypothetical protein [Paraburkholderia nemoris]|uniref:hypothetical protein n=1 Tax=Paraburkholderia nemoris TaxID=2793076 RepID=UPI001B8D1BBF|nr:hypothetical protein [Paraburkholderia nemoris]